MKKIIVLLMIIIVAIIGLCIYNNNVISNVEKDILNGLNGFELSENTDKKVASFIKEYQDKHFVNADDYIIICDNISKFNEYCEKAVEIEKILEEDPFTVVDNLDIYDSYYDDISIFYDFSNNNLEDKNAEFMEEINGKYCIKYGNISFENGEFMEIRKGKFVATLLKSDIKKITMEDAQEGMYVSSLGKKSVDGSNVYYFYDEFNNEEIVIEIDVFAGIIRKIKRV